MVTEAVVPAVGTAGYTFDSLPPVPLKGIADSVALYRATLKGP